MNHQPAYAWKSGSRHSVPAQVAGEEILRLRAENGEFFTPMDVVEAALPPSSPLHPEFEWSDKKAAVEFRKVQARQLIDHVVVIEQETPRDDWTRAFVSVRTEEGPRYTSLAYAFSVPDLRDDVLNQAKTDMQIFQRRYTKYVDLGQTIAAFAAAVKKARLGARPHKRKARELAEA